VSRSHAEIRRTPTGFVLRDLGSRNGTFVGHIAVKEAVLTAGAEIKVGTTTIRFEMGGEEGRLSRLAREPVRDDELAGVPHALRPGDRGLAAHAAAVRAVRAPGTDGADALAHRRDRHGQGRVLARAIHQASRRAGRPFVVFDCGAVAPSLIESELFGHERGSFTGAMAEHQGAFERAHRGTLLLDEIGELSIDLQPKLLRALEQRCVRRVGGRQDIPIDVRIIAATNRDLEREVRRGAFREDLFFRLSAAVLEVAPLRERLEDLPALVEHFLAETGRPLRASPETLELLASHPWPGNVRELKNAIAAAAALADGATLDPKHLVFLRSNKRPPSGSSRSLEEMERKAIEEALRDAGGNKTRAARALGIAASTLYEKIKKYSLES
jgi:transcriptional regulator of acetoin/glycerol metabolism